MDGERRRTQFQGGIDILLRKENGFPLHPETVMAEKFYALLR
jgi:hypothetical protein